MTPQEQADAYAARLEMLDIIKNLGDDAIWAISMQDGTSWRMMGVGNRVETYGLLARGMAHMNAHERDASS